MSAPADNDATLRQLLTQGEVTVPDGHSYSPLLRAMLIDATVLESGDGRLTLNPAFSRLRADAISARCGADLRVQVEAVCGSTQDLAWAALRAAPAARHVVLAEAQTAGRGRYGRSFTTAPLCSLALSLATRLPLTSVALSGLSAALGVAVAEALRAYKPVRLKWPNDLLLDGGKLGGILIAMQAGSDANSTDVCIGLGLNTLPNTGLMRVDRQTASLFAQSQGRPSRTQIAGDVVLALHAGLEQFCSTGLAAFLPRYRALDALFQRPVEVQQGSQRLRGIAHGLSEDGALLVDDGVSLHRVQSGEADLQANEQRVLPL